MKKILSLFLVLTMVFSLTACGSKEDEKPNTEKPTRDLNVSVSGEYDDEEYYDYDEEYDEDNNYEDNTESDYITDVVGYWTAADNLVLVEFTESTFKYYSPTFNKEGTYIFTGSGVAVLAEDGNYNPWLTVVDDHMVDVSEIVYTKVSEGEVAGIMQYIEAAMATPTPEESPETVGLFKYFNVKANAETGLRTKFKNGASFADRDGTGYAITKANVQVDVIDYIKDDGEGNGRATVTLTYYIEDTKPSDFGNYYYVTTAYGLYDNFTGKRISDNDSEVVVSEDYTYYETPVDHNGKTYTISVYKEKSTAWYTSGYTFISSMTYYITFPKGYKGVSLILYPADKNRSEWEKNFGVNEYPQLSNTKKQLNKEIGDALIFSIF